MKRINRRISSNLIIIAILSLLWGCSQTSATTPQPADSSTTEVEAAAAPPTGEATGSQVASGQTDSEAAAALPASVVGDPDAVTILVADKITSLDPYQMALNNSTRSIAAHIWDSLTRLNDDLVVEPHLAESWRLVNNLTWEFKLRPGVSFHNGEPVNAEAVRFSIERSQSNSTNSLETFASEVGLANVEIIDDNTIRLVTKQPVANLPYHLSFLEILPPGYYADIDLNQATTKPIGSGPYQVTEWHQGDPVVLDAFADYWQGAPEISQLIFKSVPNSQARIAALSEGEAALVTDLPPADQESFDAGRLASVESTQRLFVGMRVTADSPLANPQVRQALNYAVNVQQLIDDYQAGYGMPYGSWVSGPAGNPELSPWPYDPERARSLLEEAGYAEGFSTTLHTPVGVYPNDEEIAQAIAQQLGQIGVEVKVVPISNWDVYVRELFNNPEIALFLLRLNSHQDGLEDVSNLSPGFLFNPTGWQNDAFEDLLSRAVNTFNEESRNRLLQEAQAVAYEEAPWLWLWQPYHFYGVSPDLKWTPRADGLIYLYRSTTDSNESE
ncbi:MAG: hypothetical protein H6631_16995 [Anaerolineaceae bacterium]|nr:hypothetical protein [Anaerolineaceae bacterium]